MVCCSVQSMQRAFGIVSADEVCVCVRLCASARVITVHGGAGEASPAVPPSPPTRGVGRRISPVASITLAQKSRSLISRDYMYDAFMSRLMCVSQVISHRIPEVSQFHLRGRFDHILSQIKLLIKNSGVH